MATDAHALAQLLARNYPETLDEGGCCVPDIDAVAALLESFRAETLEQAIHICEYAARGTVEKMSRGDKSETWKIIAQNSVEQYESIVKRIRDLRADPNWLARQIAEAQIAELDALETVMDEAGMLAEWGSVAQIRYKNRRRAALAATKSQLTEGK